MPPHAPRPRVPRLGLLLLPALLAALGAGIATPGPVHARTAVATPATLAAPDAGTARAPRSQPRADRVLVVSLDALNPDALRALGHEEARTLWRLVDEGASTLNARSEVERTETLPNHTGMVTGRCIDAADGGHGVTWNDDRLEPRTVAEAAGHPVASMFTVAHRAGRSTAVFSTKTKLSLFARSWPAAVDRSTILERRDAAVVRRARADLVETRRDLTFVHLGAADVAGHAQGFMSPTYLDAVRLLDGLVGRLVSALERRPALRGTVVVLTADHGGAGTGHYRAGALANYRIPFTVWGRGVPASRLYRRNPGFAEPGTDRVAYGTASEPVRNGDVANLALDLIGLGPVPGSTLDHAQDLRVG